MKKVLLVFLLCIFVSFTLNDFFGRKTLIYQEVGGKNLLTISFNIKEKEHGFSIEKINNLGLTNLEYATNFQLQKLIYKETKVNTNYSIDINDKKLLKAEGLYLGRKFKAVERLNIPWIQDFYFGFHNFLLSKTEELSFYIFNPDKFDLMEMVASKKGKEILTINGQKYITRKLKITLTGFKKHFWKAEAWYDLETLNLVQYRANEGPGTPTTLTTLIK